MTDIALLVGLAIAFPAVVAIVLFVLINILCYALGDMPPNNDWQTFIEMVLFMYCHLLGRPFLMVGWLEPAKAIYGIANQRVYRNDNGNLVVTPNND